MASHIAPEKPAELLVSVHLRKKALRVTPRQTRDGYWAHDGDPQAQTLCGSTPTTADIGWADVRVANSPSFALVTCAGCRDLRFDAEAAA